MSRGTPNSVLRLTLTCARLGNLAAFDEWHRTGTSIYPPLIVRKPARKNPSNPFNPHPDRYNAYQHANKNCRLPSVYVNLCLYDFVCMLSLPMQVNRYTCSCVCVCARLRKHRFKHLMAAVYPHRNGSHQHLPQSCPGTAFAGLATGPDMWCKSRRVGRTLAKAFSSMARCQRCSAHSLAPTRSSAWMR